MSHYSIQKLSDFDFILDDEIMLFGNIHSVDEEIYHNMWIIDIEQKFGKNFMLKDLTKIIENLLQNRSEQIQKKYPGIKATFYLWYDPQSVQLKFNILSGQEIQLPFGCKINVFNNFLPILKTFLDDIHSDSHPLDWKNFTILNPGDPGWDDDDDETSNWIQDVYVTTLPCAKMN